MNNLVNIVFILYFIEKNGPTITQLCYVDDTIMFSSCEPDSLSLMMSKLDIYEQTSGQMVNKEKYGFYTLFLEDDQRNCDINRITGFLKCQFSNAISWMSHLCGQKKGGVLQ